MDRYVEPDGPASMFPDASPSDPDSPTGGAEDRAAAGGPSAFDEAPAHLRAAGGADASRIAAEASHTPGRRPEWPSGPVPKPASAPPPGAGGRPAARSGRFLIPFSAGFLGAGLALAAVALAGGLGFGGQEAAVPSTTTTTVAPTSSETEPNPAATLRLTTASGVDAAAVGERVIPSIVTVQVGRETANAFQGFGSGSGVVLDSEGHIVTNDHVVDGSGSYQVVFADGRTYPATLVGSDPITDLAVLQISSAGLQPIGLGSTEDLQVGDPAIAIGNPLGLEGGPSLTVGVLSAFDRQVQTSANVILYGMLQTDAPITQGSSGGALVDDQGRLIGITTAVGVSSIGVEGVGFATPVEIVERVTRDIITTGSAHNAFLGIRGSTGFDTATDGAEVPSGVLVASVDPQGAAGAAGIRADDLIVSFDGHAVQTMQDLVVLLRKAQVGDVVAVQIERSGAVLDLEVTLLEG